VNLPPLADVQVAIIQQDGLAAFVKRAWPLVEPVDPLIWNWHHDAMCEHTEAVLQGELKNLLINVPPGFTKSMIVSVMASAYAWTIKPGYRIIAISHKDALARRDSRKVRSLVLSPWYRERWPDVVLEKLDEARLENVATGFRIIGSVQSGITGERGNLALVDDPLTPEKADSPAERDRASRFFWETLPTRFTDYKKAGKIVIMQRLHGQDTSGEIIERADAEWEKLILPNEYEPARCCVTVLGFEDPRTEEDELLHPERLGPEETAEMKSEAGVGLRVYHGQFQQSPRAREGNIIKEEWLARRFGARGAEPLMVVQSWDCGSKDRKKNDPSACGTFAVFKDRVEMWDYSLKRQQFPALERRAKDKHEEFTPSHVLIEDKDAGQQLIQVLKARTKIPVVACNPGDVEKMLRLETESGFVESGSFWLPERAPWVAAFVEELITVPAAPHDESADVLSQFLRWLRLKKKKPKGGAPVSVGKEAGKVS